MADIAYLDEMPEPAELTWTDLHYRVKAGTPPRSKTVLHTSSGTFKPGDSVALMGPSGAGEFPSVQMLVQLKAMAKVFKSQPGARPMESACLMPRQSQKRGS